MLMAVRKKMHYARKNIQLLGAYFKLNLSASMEYRTSFIIQIFGMFLNNLSFAFFWWLLFERFETIGGYGFNDVMLLWAFASSGFGLCFILFGNLRRLVDIIIKGELDSYLLQPKNVLLNVIGSSTRVSAWGDFVYGIILFFIIKGFAPMNILMFVFFTITACLLYSSVMITFSSLAFKFGNINSLATLAVEFMITLSIYPADMFQGFVKFILFTVLPAGFATMVPVNLLTEFDLKWFLMLIIVTVIWVVLAFASFYRGLKRYESGNLMVQKM